MGLYPVEPVDLPAGAVGGRWPVRDTETAPAPSAAPHDISSVDAPASLRMAVKIMSYSVCLMLLALVMGIVFGLAARVWVWAVGVL